MGHWARMQTYAANQMETISMHVRAIQFIEDALNGSKVLSL